MPVARAHALSRNADVFARVVLPLEAGHRGPWLLLICARTQEALLRAIVLLRLHGVIGC